MEPPPFEKDPLFLPQKYSSIHCVPFRACDPLTADNRLSLGIFPLLSETRVPVLCFPGHQKSAHVSFAETTQQGYLA